MPRVRLSEISDVAFEASGLAPKLANISLTGVGFLKATASGWPGVGAELPGRLRLFDRSFDVSIRVIHYTGLIAGCAFQGKLLELQRAIREFFKMELAALNMVKAPADVLQAVPDGLPMWFGGRNNCELFLVLDRSDPHSIIRFQLSFFGNFIEGGRDAATRYGVVVREEEKGSPQYKGSDLVRWQNRFPSEMNAAIERFLQHILELEDSAREQLVRMLRGAPGS
jgi:hypothetical protein